VRLLETNGPVHTCSVRVRLGPAILTTLAGGDRRWTNSWPSPIPIATFVLRTLPTLKAYWSIICRPCLDLLGPRVPAHQSSLLHSGTGTDPNWATSRLLACPLNSSQKTGQEGASQRPSLLACRLKHHDLGSLMSTALRAGIFFCIAAAFPHRAVPMTLHSNLDRFVGCLSRHCVHPSWWWWWWWCCLFFAAFAVCLVLCAHIDRISSSAFDRTQFPPFQFPPSRNAQCTTTPPFPSPPQSRSPSIRETSGP
jgi:hypothetical protein